MDEYLARIYGTGGGEDLEKTAQMHLLQKLAEDDNVDLSGLSDEELQSLHDEVMSDGEYEEGLEEDPIEAQAQQELLQKEAEAKFEEADFLGRVMAHAYTQELEKIAASYGPAEKAEHKREARGAGRISGAMGALGGGTLGAMSGGTTGNKILRGAIGAAGGGALGYGGGYTASRAGNRVTRAVGGEGIGSKRKEASAFNKLAMMKAAEMLEAVGIDPATGQEQGQPGQQPGQQAGGQPGMQQPQQRGVTPQAIAQEMARRQGGQQPGMQQPGMQQPGLQQGMQQEQDPGEGGEEEFDGLVNERALQMLQQAGYDPEEIVQALQQQQSGGEEQQLQPQMQQQPQLRQKLR